MSSKQPRPTTLGELVRRIANADSLPSSPKPPLPEPPSQKGDSGIISPRDQRGTPYHGDFPNPASDRTKGCF
jgi:hypothetical protein